MYIDSLSENASRDSRQTAQSWLESKEQEFLSQSDYVLDDQDRSFLDLLSQSLQKLKALLVEATPDQPLLMFQAQQFSALWYRFELRQKSQRFPNLPALDALVTVLQARLNAKAEDLAVTKRIAPAVAEWEDLSTFYVEVRGKLSEELSTHLDLVFRSQRQLLQSVAVGHNSPEIVAQLTNAAAQIAPLADRSADQTPDLLIPVVGSILSEYRLNTEPELWNHFVKTLPDLQRHWDRFDDGWLLPATLAEGHLEKTADLIDQLEQVAQSVPLEFKAFWDTVNALDAAFRFIQNHRLPVEVALESYLGPETALVLALLQEEAPLESADAAIEAIRAGDVPDFLLEYADTIESFLESGDKLVLLTVLEKLIDEVKGLAPRP